MAAADELSGVRRLLVQGPKSDQREKAVVVFGGGQDSTTCLVQAQARYDEVHAITFDYGQRRRAEIETAASWPGRSGSPPTR